MRLTDEQTQSLRQLTREVAGNKAAEIESLRREVGVLDAKNLNAGRSVP